MSNERAHLAVVDTMHDTSAIATRLEGGSVAKQAADVAFDRDTAIRAARRFYLEDRSKVEIADELGISRFKVARLLELARERGLVKITIDDEGAVDEGRSARLARALGLARAVVVSASGSKEHVRSVVGRAAAPYLSDSLRDGEVLGVGWGRTLSALAAAIESLPDVSVVQMTGATHLTGDLSPLEIVRLLEHHAGRPVVPIFAPLIADDASTAAAFRGQSDIARALAMHDRVTTAVMSFGSWDPAVSQLAEATEPRLRDELAARGVVAEIGVTLIDAHGNEIATDYSDRCVAVRSEQLRAIPRVIGVAASAEKGIAAVALARAGLITELVVDVQLADEAIRIAEDGIDGAPA